MTDRDTCLVQVAPPRAEESLCGLSGRNLAVGGEQKPLDGLLGRRAVVVGEAVRLPAEVGDIADLVQAALFGDLSCRGDDSLSDRLL